LSYWPLNDTSLSILTKDDEAEPPFKGGSAYF